MEINETIATMRLLNQTAIKTHALKCSKDLRAGKFTRVSQSFLDDVQADAERIIREIRSKYQPSINALVAPEPGTKFVTGNFMQKAEEILNDAIPRIIQTKIQRHPSVGKTLMS